LQYQQWRWCLIFWRAKSQCFDSVFCFLWKHSLQLNFDLRFTTSANLTSNIVIFKIKPALNRHIFNRFQSYWNTH
jgi:hypothetical protein